MSRKSLQLITFIGAVCLALLGSPCQSGAEPVGNVAAIEGNASLRRANENDFKKVVINEIVKISDMMQTDAGSKLYLKFSESSHASMGEDSEMYIFDSSVDQQATFFGSDVSAGSIRFIKKLGETKPPSSYTVTTPTAMINVDPAEKPADFVVTVHGPKRTTVTVIRGQIRVKNLSENLTQERLVDSCKSVYVEEGKEPSRPMGVSSSRLRELIAITTIPNTLNQEVPECEARHVFKPECSRCTAWDGHRCVPCEELGLACLKGRCVQLDCGPCKVQWEDRCVPCKELGLVCDRGRCVRKGCPPCRIWDGRRCVKCEDIGRVCVDGRCVRPLECPPCSFWNGRRCVGCAELGMLCIDGRCAFRPCGPCEIRRGGVCVPCADLGLRCVAGRCAVVIPVEGQQNQPMPERPIGVKPPLGPAIQQVLPPALGVVPPSVKPGMQPGLEPPAGSPEKPAKPGRPEKPEKPGLVKPPAVGAGKPEGSKKPIESGPLQVEKPEKQINQERPAIQKPGTIPNAPKPLDTEAGPRPRPMPEAPKLEQRRENKPERQKPASQIEQPRTESRPSTGQERSAPEVKSERKPEQRIERSSTPPAAARPEMKMERSKPEHPSKPAKDARGDDRKER